MGENYVRYRTSLPMKLLSPLIEKTFGEPIEKSLPKYREILPKLYAQFQVSLMGGNSIVARGMLPTEISCINSMENLEPYRKHLGLCGPPRSPHIVMIESEQFKSFLKEYHTKSELERMKSRGMNLNGMLGEVVEDSIASSLWCMMRIVKGDNIGVVYNPERDLLPENPIARLPMEFYFENYLNLRFPLADAELAEETTPKSKLADMMADSAKDFEEAMKEGNIRNIAAASRRMEKYSKGLEGP